MGLRARRRCGSGEDESGAARTPIVALTGHTEENEKAKALASGMDDFIAKPFTSDDLSRIMKAFPPPDGRPSTGPKKEPELTPGVRRSKRLMELFLQHVPQQLSELREAQRTGNAPDVRAHAHKLKGSCLALDARPMAKAAESLQHESEAGDLTRADALCTEQEERFEVVQGLIQKELGA